MEGGTQMNLYKKCVQFSSSLLPDDIGQTNSLVEIENNGTTIPGPVKLDEFIKEFVCNNILYVH